MSKPYRKASEYLANHQKPTISGGELSPCAQENDALRQKLLILTRKLERSENEFSQSREYWENQIDLAHDKELKISNQYKALQSSYALLQAKNRELEERLLKVNRLETERDSMNREINELSRSLSESKNALLKSQEENERLRKDCNLAVQLLKCNQANYQRQRPDQLPVDIQEKVSSYKVELQDYNEYINPYADECSDSDSENAASDHNKHHNSNNFAKGAETDHVPVEFLAEVLKKPENVHMNLEASDYIQDPSLHSAYKAHYVQRKLIKPNYKQDFSVHLPSSMQETRISGTKLPSTTAEQTVIKQDDSPWELAPSRKETAVYQDEDDESPAGAYGAYSVATKRKSYMPRKESSLQSNPTNTDKFSERRGSPSPERLQFRKPAMPSKTGKLSDYFSKSTKSSPSLSSTSSNHSSKKSSPLKVCGKESATTAETSSLLKQSDSEEDDVTVKVSHFSIKRSSPNKSYLEKEVSGEHHDSLLASDNNVDLQQRIYMRNSAILDAPPEEMSDELKQLSFDQTHSHAKPQEDLLLSMDDVDSAVKSEQNLHNDFIHPQSPETQKILYEGNDLLPPPNPSGQLLSEIVTNNPSLSSFLMTAPPPPVEFSSIHDSSQLPSNSLLLFSSQKSHPPDVEHPESVTRLPPTSVEQMPVRVDDQIEVIDLDEEPKIRVNRRRNSFDQAQEYGSILNA